MGIYVDMNYYGRLLKVEDQCAVYSYGCRVDNMTGILLIDTDSAKWTNKRLPDGIEGESYMFYSFANKVLRQCMRGEILEKVSREIG